MTQKRSTCKRSTRKRKRSTRKGGRWTPRENSILTHRILAANYATTSKQSAEQADRSIRAYLDHKNELQKKIQKKRIKYFNTNDILAILNTDVKSLTDYTTEIKNRAIELINKTIRENNQTIMKEYGNALHNIILANHNMTRTQQIAHLAALEHLSNLTPSTVQKWNQTLLRRSLENNAIQQQADAIREKLQSTPQNDPHLRFLLMKELAEEINDYDRIYILRRSDEMSVSSLPLSARKEMRTPSAIIDTARQYYMTIPVIKNSLEKISKDNFMIRDRVLPSAAETIMLLYVRASYDYLHHLPKGSEQYKTQLQECESIKTTLGYMSQIHTTVLSDKHSNLGPKLRTATMDLKKELETIT